MVQGAFILAILVMMFVALIALGVTIGSYAGFAILAAAVGMSLITFGFGALAGNNL